MNQQQPGIVDGYDAEGYPITAGGERITGGFKTREKYAAERNILNDYQRVKQLHAEVEEMRQMGAPEQKQGRESNNRQRIDGMRKSVDPLEQRQPRDKRKKKKNSRSRSRSKSPRNADTTDADTASEQDRPPYYALIRDSMLLEDWQVTMTYLNYMFSISLFVFPLYSQKYGILNGVLANVVVVIILIKSNQNLIKAIPISMMHQNLCYSQIVGQVFGHRAYKTILDIIIFLCCTFNYILFIKFLAVQANEMICTESLKNFCLQDNTDQLLGLYYAPITAAIFSISQLRNYKQLSWISALGVLCFLVALGAILHATYERFAYYTHWKATHQGLVEKLQIEYDKTPQTEHIPWFYSFYPFLMDCICKQWGGYQGVQIVPRLYTSSRHKNFFVRNINRAVIYIGVFHIILGVCCVAAYGETLQELIVMCIQYDETSRYFKGILIAGMTANLVWQLDTVLEIFQTYQPKVYGYGTSPNQNQDRSVHLYLYDPNLRTGKQTLFRIMNSLIVLTIWLGILLPLHNFTSPTQSTVMNVMLLINGAVFANILMLMIPNAMYLHQTNYGYLKGHESYFDYGLAHLLFYFSIFNMIYAAFRGIQLAMGELGVKSIVS